MRRNSTRYHLLFVLLLLPCPIQLCFGQIPDHPVITEVYTDPIGVNDGPVARDPLSTSQEFIEIYLPPAASLNPLYNKDALRLTFYEIEGDADSSGPNLVNYRFDLPTFDLDSLNGITVGAVERPSSGIVVLGWVDYVGNPPTGLAGTPSTRVALINGGITSTGGSYVFVAINGNHFTGTTNFPVPTAENLIDLPSEATSGVIQNGSGAYLLVNRDLAGYVQLCDDQHAGSCPSGAFPDLPNDLVLLNTTSLHDAFGGNDDANFDVLDQPSPDGNNIDLGETLPPGGAFSQRTCQVPENITTQPNPGVANGYARRFVDVAKTTESAAADDPVTDAQNAYRHVRNDGPFFATPGSAVFTMTAPELSVAAMAEQSFQVLSGTTGGPAFLSANVGGNFPINMTTSAGGSSNPAVATFAGGTAANAVMGQSFGLPTIAISGAIGAAHNSTATSSITVTATNTNGGDPAVVNPIRMTTATATILKPTTGLNSVGGAFQTTVFVGVLPITANGAVTNEFRASSLGSFLASLPDITAVQTLGNGAALINPATDFSNGSVITPMIDDIPDFGQECTNWLFDAGPPGKLSLYQTVSQSAENISNANTYLDSLATCPLPLRNVVKAEVFNVPDTTTFGGGYTPTEPLYFVDSVGAFGNLRSGLSNATTTRTFELAIVDTNVRADSTIESGKTDDFGLIIKVGTESGNSVVPGEFVFLSFTGGLQGADVDPRLDATTLAYVYLLDLDNLQSVLGIDTVESLYVVDGSATGVLEVIEVFKLPEAPLADLTAAVPATQQSLWRTRQNIIRLTFDANVTLPPAGSVLIQQMLPGGTYGADQSSGFTYTIENDGLGNPRILKILDTDPSNLTHRNWYAVRNTGSWTGVSSFTLQYVTQIGDANNDRQVLNADVGLINAGIPNFNSGDNDRRDIDGDSAILNADASSANLRIPSFLVAKPSGH